MGKELVALPRQIDRLLQTIAGEGNDILFWFLRGVAVAAAVIGPIMAVAILVWMATG